MDTYCTRPGCPDPHNHFPDLDEPGVLSAVEQKYCNACGMPQILDGRYIASRLLGRGGFGAAYYARDRRTPKLRPCTLKQFLPPAHLAPKALQVARELFAREAEALEELGKPHPQIPDLYAYFPVVVPEANGSGSSEFFYLAQEFIDGDTLEAERDRAPFSEAALRETLAEVLHILQFVHERGSIHRDIKPSNIMRSREGRLYLLDFGAVKQVAAAGGAAKSTGIYSQGYAPPEQMKGAMVYPSTDLYALAATCLTLATGRPVEDIYDTYTDRWRWQGVSLSPGLRAILQRMLEPVPADRFASAAEVLDAIAALPAASDALPEAKLPSLQSADAPRAARSPAPRGDDLPRRASPPPPPAPRSGPAPIRASPARSPAPRPARAPRFTAIELLGNAAFVGAAGAALLLILTGLISAAPVAMGVWGMAMGGAIYALYRRFIEKIDLPILAAISLVGALVAVGVGGTMPPATAIALVITAGAATTMAMAVFQLVYRLTQRWLG